MEENKRTYDVEFNNDTDSNSKGIHGTYEECMDWIEFNRGDESTYFGDYKTDRRACLYRKYLTFKITLCLNIL